MIEEVAIGPCNVCRRQDSRHTVVTAFDNHWMWDDDLGSDFIEGEDRFLTLRCGGCSTVSFKMELHDPVAIKNYQYISNNVEVHYPAPIRRHMPDWTEYVSVSTEYPWIVDLLSEVYFAFNARQFRLAAMGLRALIETVMIDRVGDQGSFAANLNAILGKGMVTVPQLERIKTALDLGDAAIHRNHVPENDDIRFTLDFVEHLIAGEYVHPQLVGSITKPPPRLPRKSMR